MLARNTLINVISVAASLVLGLATTALLTRHLGLAGFGLLVLTRSIVGNAGLVETLFGIGTTRFVAFYTGRNETHMRDRFIGTSLVVNLLQGLLISFGGMVVALLFFDTVFGNIPVELRYEGRVMLIAFLVVLTIQITSVTLGRVLEGLQTYSALRTVEVAAQLFTFMLLSGYFLWFGASPIHQIAWAFGIAELFRLASLVAVTHRAGVRLIGSLRSMHASALKELVHFGRPMFVAKLATMLGARGDAILLGIFASVQAIANYQVANQVWSAVVAGLSALTIALFPTFAHRVENTDEWSSSIFLRASRYVLAMTLTLAILVVYGRTFLVDRWVGPAFAGAATLILLFMIQVVIAYHQGVSSVAVLGLNQHHPVGNYELVGAISGFVVSLLLVRRLGATGLLIGAIVKAAVIMPLYTRLALSRFRIPWRRYMREAVFPVWRFFAAVVAVVLVVRASAGVIGTGAPAFMVQFTMLALGAGTLMWLMVLTAEDRKRVARAVAF